MAFSVAGDLYFEIDGQLHEIKRLLRQKRGCPYDPALVKKALQAIVEGRFDKLVEVPISDELQQLIGACKFHSVDDNIMGEKFPLEDDQPDYEYSLEVLHLNKGLTTTEVLDEIKKQGYEVASLRDLLVYCAEHQEVGLEWPLVALGSVWQDLNGDRGCPCVWSDGNGQHLLTYLRWFDGGWGDRSRFLVRSKRQP